LFWLVAVDKSIQSGSAGFGGFGGSVVVSITACQAVAPVQKARHHLLARFASKALKLGCIWPTSLRQRKRAILKNVFFVVNKTQQQCV
jgi:hypothetical protein